MGAFHRQVRAALNNGIFLRLRPGKPLFKTGRCLLLQAGRDDDAATQVADGAMELPFGRMALNIVALNQGDLVKDIALLLYQ